MIKYILLILLLLSVSIISCGHTKDINPSDNILTIHKLDQLTKDSVLRFMDSITVRSFTDPKKADKLDKLTTTEKLILLGILLDKDRFKIELTELNRFMNLVQHIIISGFSALILVIIQYILIGLRRSPNSRTYLLLSRIIGWTNILGSIVILIIYLSFLGDPETERWIFIPILLFEMTFGVLGIYRIRHQKKSLLL